VVKQAKLYTLGKVEKPELV